jgi:carbohydrate binding protein with CBM6 domain/phospholipase D-like protein
MENLFNKMATLAPRRRVIPGVLLGCVSLVLGISTAASAQEQLMFTATDDAQAQIVGRINNERTRVDVATWLLNDGDIVAALIRKYQSGVPVRIIGDRASIFESDPNTRAAFEQLAQAGVPIRLRYFPRDVLQVMHWKCGIFVGQNTAEIGSGNWTTFELKPWDSWNFHDETAFFTNDSTLVNALLTKFDEMWTDTTNFLDWPDAYRTETGVTWPYPMTVNRAPQVPPGFPTNMFVWSQGTELTNAMLAEINKENSFIDFVLYRLSAPGLSDALIARKQAGVNVRVMIEPTQYHNPKYPEYEITGAEVDKLYAAGIPIRQRVHDGLTHMKSLITSTTALIASSNFTKFWQRDHNYFVQASTKPAVYTAYRDRFNAMWADNVNYTAFTPLPPDGATLVYPAQNAGSIPTTVALQWNRAFFAVAFDVYMDTNPNPTTFRGTVNAQVDEFPPPTYSLTVGGLQPLTTYYWRVVSRTFAGRTGNSSIQSFTTASGGGGGGGGTSTPFGGTPTALPGTLQSENFDEGGEGVAYHDLTTTNSGGQYRLTDAVDLATTTDTGGGYVVGWAGAGEWLKYSVNVGAAGNYDLEFRVASAGTGGTFHLEVNGVDKTGPMSVPTTNGWDSWMTLRKTAVALGAGAQVWRLVLDSNGPTGAVANFNWIRATASGGGGGGTSTPFGGTPTALPGTLQFENFDEGGEGVAYHDLTTTNSGGQYRLTDAVDLATTTDTGGGFQVGWAFAGEWLQYTVNVTTAGTYNIDVRVASAGNGGTFHIEVNGVDKTGPMTVQNTNGWDTWTTVRKAGVALSAGVQVWRVVMDSNGPTTAVGNFNNIRVQ